MRRLILILALVSSAFAQSVVLGGSVTIGGSVSIGIVAPVGGGCGSGYSNVIPVTFIAASGSDLTNFPARVSGRDHRLATSANGGSVQNLANNSIGISGPADLVFCPDQTLSSTPLKYESTPVYDPATGDYEFFVQVPTYHTASNDTAYLYFNNSAVSTSQQDLSLWSDVNYALVAHYGTISTIGLLNSVTGTAVTNVNSVGSDFGLGGSASLGKGNASKYLKIADAAAFRPTSAVTLESWGWAYAGTSNELISKPYRNSGWSSPFLSYRLLLEGPDKLSMDVTTSGVLTGATSTGLVPLQTFTYLAGTYADGGAGLKAFIDGSPDGTAAKTGTIDYNGCTTCDVGLGVNSPGGAVTWWQGLLDEQRIASDAKSADWIATNFLSVNPYTSGSYFSESSWTTPTLVQKAGCDAPTGTSATCTTKFSATAGGTMVFSAILIDATGATCPSVLGYTNRCADSHAGTLHTYQSCIYTAPVSSSGIKTASITSNPAGTSAILQEWQGVTTTGIACATAGGALQPTTMTASCSGTTCVQMCLTNFGTDNLSGNPVVVNPTSMRFEFGPTFQDSNHQEFAGLEWKVVGSGSQSCSFPTVGAGYQGRSGVAMILPAP